jgi:PKD repeat protein
LFVGQAFQAQALNSTLASDTPLTATYQWNFGDDTAGSTYNQLNGWNAAHVYNTPGVYTVTLTLTGDTGQSSTDSIQVDVSSTLPLRTIYVSATGNDANNGLSPATAIQSVAQAQALLGNNTQVLFEDGDTFPMSAGLYSAFDNVMFGSYVGASGLTAQPVLFWTGGPANYSMISDAATSDGLTVNGLTFDSIYDATSTQTPPDAISPQGSDITITNNTFLNLGYDVNLNAGPDGVMVENNTSPATTGLRGYFVWAQGSDLTILGNTAVNSTTQHIVRVGGADRMLIAYNNFANVNVYNKDTITVQIGQYAYIAHNTLLQGSTNIGPTDASGLVNDPAQQAASFAWAVFEDNTIYVPLTIQAGASDVAVRGNIAFANNSTAFIVQGFNAAYNRGVSNVAISGNTEINDGTSGSFVTLLGTATGISLTDNLYVAPNLVFGNIGDTIGAPVQVETADLSSFSDISGNVWPAYFDSDPAKGGEMFIAALGSSFYATPDQWNTYPQVSGDEFEAVALPADYLSELSAFAADGVQLFASGD